MNDQPAPDGLCVVDHNAQQDAAKVGADAFGNGLPEMDGAVKDGHGKDGLPANITYKGQR